MQNNLRYFTVIKIAHILSILFLATFNLDGVAKRNPFCFYDKKINVPFSCTAIAQVHKSSKSFAILSCIENSQRKNIIAKKGDLVFGFKIVDMFNDTITIQDDHNNEVILRLK
jgi:hypothetical protein